MRLSVEAHPNARAARLEVVDDSLHVWVRARAIDGQANAAIEQTIARALRMRNRQVRIVSGARSRHKTLEVDLADIDELRQQLAQL
jgi:uncharacterized protein YggU (UPF0235/DUF167 family)